MTTSEGSYVFVFFKCLNFQELISRFWPVWPKCGNTGSVGPWLWVMRGPKGAQKTPLTLKILYWGVFGDYFILGTGESNSCLGFGQFCLLFHVQDQQDHSLNSKNSIYTPHVQTR